MIYIYTVCDETQNLNYTDSETFFRYQNSRDRDVTLCIYINYSFRDLSKTLQEGKIPSQYDSHIHFSCSIGPKQKKSRPNLVPPPIFYKTSESWIYKCIWMLGSKLLGLCEFIQESPVISEHPFFKFRFIYWSGLSQAKLWIGSDPLSGGNFWITWFL